MTQDSVRDINAPGPRILDLGCGAGGASTGYDRAGFDVFGLDVKPQPNYPFPFKQMDMFDALTQWDWFGEFDAIHAGPVCKRYSRATRHELRGGHPDQIAALRALLDATGLRYIIENVPGAPLRPDLKLCGCMFGLEELERERWFELGAWSAFELRAPCYHAKPVVTVVGHGSSRTAKTSNRVADWRRAMGIDWMTRDELNQAIPPAYTAYIGKLLLDEIAVIGARETI